MKIIKKNGKHFQGTICYSLTEQRMGGEIYNIDYYVSKAKQLKQMGADSICIKDMAGLVAPYDAYNLVKALKENVSRPIHLHTPYCNIPRAWEILPCSRPSKPEWDINDTCMAPYAIPDFSFRGRTLVITLLGTNRDTVSISSCSMPSAKKWKKLFPNISNLRIIQSFPLSIRTSLSSNTREECSRTW